VIMRRYSNNKEVNKMRGRNKHPTREAEPPIIPGVVENRELVDGKAPGILSSVSTASSDLGSILVDLEKSDAFEQRLSIINSEIERQLKTSKTQEEVWS